MLGIVVLFLSLPTALLPVHAGSALSLSLAKINLKNFFKKRLGNLPKGHPADEWQNLEVKLATVSLAYNTVLLNTMLHVSSRLRANI